ANWNSNRPLTINLGEFFASEPYVYVQTYNDIYKLTTPLLELAHADPRFYHLVGHILRPSPYPLPWILGDFPRVGYYEHDNNPPDVDADFLLVEESKIPEVEQKLRDTYYSDSLTVRPYQDTSKLYLRASVFRDFFPERLPNFIGPGKQYRFCNAPVVGRSHLCRSFYRNGTVAWRECWRTELEHFICFPHCRSNRRNCPFFSNAPYAHPARTFNTISCWD